jgi:hypothetical protein
MGEDTGIFEIEFKRVKYVGLTFPLWIQFSRLVLDAQYSIVSNATNVRQCGSRVSRVDSILSARFGSSRNMRL